ncbi:DNA-binding protein WhiA [Propionispira raffinosivorans]|uniref:DNA-binding protein WhiA n=1 Tax=Propionispira raffinosivorans TaxID=86959 RepID=UPI000377F6CF|nr:DNA-binding protein WhiA [Propionispira raffinosivorans]
MPSFATEVKNEVARLVDENSCCKIAELAALLRMGAVMTMGGKRSLGINFTTENAAVARRTLTLLKSSGEVRTEVMVSRARRLKKHNSYCVRVIPSLIVSDLLAKLGLMHGATLNVGSDSAILRKHCCRHAYLRGAFLGGGSVNRPEGSYHLELVTGSEVFAQLLLSLCRKFDLPVGLSERKNDYIVYIKESDAIMDFLAIIGAENALVEFEVARNLKEVRNQVNRLVNCETANLQKTANASVRQMEHIKLIKAKLGFDSLPEPLQEIAVVRLSHPDASLKELAEVLHISKSGINHRLRKLEKIAVELTEGEAD